MINIISKLIMAALVLLIICAAPVNTAAFGAEPYQSYNYDKWGEAVPSQAGYTAERTVTGKELGAGELNSPKDIFRDENGFFYIADSGNNRIIVTDAELRSTVKVISSLTMADGEKTELFSPMGVYVSPETGLLYIADNGNSRVLVCDSEENVTAEITKPDSEIYDSEKPFMPQRVLADRAGNIYLILGSITSGAAMFSGSGEFLGFYGANKVRPTAEIVSNYVRNIFTSGEKRKKSSRSVPSGITGFDIDGDFIFTCSSSKTRTNDTVKKLNAAGDNIFDGRELTFGDYISVYDETENISYETKICDIDISGDGNINCLDYTAGRVFQYDEDCNLLFITGGIAEQTGGFERPAAIESDTEHLYVLDEKKNYITVFTETAFGEAVHKAARLYNEGRYEEALSPWQEVLRLDGNYRRAYIGVASGLLTKGDYEGAMKYAKLAELPSVYNKAFEGYRLNFLREHFAVLCLCAAAATGGIVLLVRHRKKKR